MSAKGPGRGTYAAIYAAGALGAVYLALVHVLSGPSPALRSKMADASRLMARAAAAVRDCRAARGLALDLAADPNGTGLIGLETSPITTSLGRLEAKRTTTNPRVAGLAVSLLHAAGVRKGDAVAVGASSSFPALIVATLCAIEALAAEPLVISSLGSSEWGANDPAFLWLDMEDCLRAAGLFEFRPVALALGGEEDVGRDMDPAGRALLAESARGRGVPLLEEPDLARNVAARMRLYRERAGGRPIKAFVNIGGSYANIGTSAEVLKLRPGLAGGVPLPPPARRGALQAMAAAGVPVVHLLNIKGLCERYGLPWDPRPLPGPGGEGAFDAAGWGAPLPAALPAGYILLVAAVLAAGRRRL